MRNAATAFPIIGAMILGTCILGAAHSQPVLVDDVYHAITTVRDMHSLGVSLEAYYADHKRYPAADASSELKPILQGRYTTILATEDAWGTPIKYLVSADGLSYRLVSAGSDRTFNESTWKQTGISTDSRDDAVYAHHFTRKWAIDIP